MCVAAEDAGGEAQHQERVLGPTDSLKGSHDGLAILPAAIRSLVERRREVKRMMKSAKSPAERQQLDIRQQVSPKQSSLSGHSPVGAPPWSLRHLSPPSHPFSANFSSNKDPPTLLSPATRVSVLTFPGISRSDLI